jgi:hypothetical protein
MGGSAGAPVRGPGGPSGVPIVDGSEGVGGDDVMDASR